jgi:hypothetical protein
MMGMRPSVVDDSLGAVHFKAVIHLGRDLACCHPVLGILDNAVREDACMLYNPLAGYTAGHTLYVTAFAPIDHFDLQQPCSIDGKEKGNIRRAYFIKTPSYIGNGFPAVSGAAAIGGSPTR